MGFEYLMRCKAGHCRAHSTGEARIKSQFAAKALHALRQANGLAKILGQELGQCEILL